MRPSSGRRLRQLRSLGLSAAAVYLLTAILVQALHPRFDWLQAPLSFYLSGPNGVWLQTAYGLLALAIGGLGWECARLNRQHRANAVAALLFLIGSISLVLTALFPGGSPEHVVSPDMHRLHGWAARAAFYATGLGLLLQGVLDWREGSRVLLPLAMITLGLLALSQLAPGLPRGLGQKIAIAAYLICLAWMAWSLPMRASNWQQ
ncbi:DUF998 domain-containing protein [Pseudomarimonas arenosa]|uniref:DUF998 domain-containing protein n=1 Tax=Pseudomarimonas arenosa TaxID=2774145 RepID=A0AAW3ZIN0_9GAMM|nr:DUF998 domain-containing protein [Pseudomarimonas arenosa]MBD8525638.1 DUF998 domain-containing protein [Pseudomarimonas arenosa]